MISSNHKSEVVRQLAYTRLLLIITLRFTCGERKIYLTIKKFKISWACLYILNFSFNKQFSFLGKNPLKKNSFLSKTEKKNLTIKFFIVGLVEVPNFRFFRTNLPKMVFAVSNKKIAQSFRLNWHFWIFGSKRRQNEHHHWIRPIRICLDTKFQLERTVLIFWTIFVQKRYYTIWFKTTTTKKKKLTIKACIFEFVYEANFSLKLTIFSFLDQICPKRV